MQETTINDIQEEISEYKIMIRHAIDTDDKDVVVWKKRFKTFRPDIPL